MAQVAETMHKDSCMCSKSELDFFSVPPTQVVMEKGFWEDVDLITSISSSDTIEFLCAENSGVDTDLASSYLYVKAKITTAAGGNVGADIQVGPSEQQTISEQQTGHPIKHSLPLSSVYRNDPEL